jgi:hypothetical protein
MSFMNATQRITLSSTGRDILRRIRVNTDSIERIIEEDDGAILKMVSGDSVSITESYMAFTKLLPE